jgi:hypothetical protein
MFHRKSIDLPPCDRPSSIVIHSNKKKARPGVTALSVGRNGQREILQ